MQNLSRREAIGITLAAAAVGLHAAPERPLTVLYYGTDTPLPRLIPLRAGPLTMAFEPELAQLRSIRLGEREVIRSIYAAVRDQNWGTLAPRLSNLRVETTDETCSLTFNVECKQGQIDFGWRGTISGDAQGNIRFDFDGSARSTFRKNRLGFCVLHPIEGCAGHPVTIGKADGKEQRGTFPADISPHQPFMDIRSIRHNIQPGVDAQVQFEGDVFEMEDHRNWTDASFKTYCTPLGLPFPVEVKQGAAVRQSVSLRLIGTAPRISVRPLRSEVIVEVQPSQATPLPRLGLGIGPEAANTQRLRALGLNHLRVDLRLAEDSWTALLTRAAREANAIGAALEIALTVGGSPAAELERLGASPALKNAKVAQYLVFDRKWLATARRMFGTGKIASGTDLYFTELNRERPPIAESDAVCYSVNPQVHAFDNTSLVETLAMQAETVRCARKFCGTLPISVTPVTLKPRTAADPRQTSLFGAVWTLGSLKYLAEGGAASVTYYETTGSRGVMDRDVFPLYHVLADAGEFAGGSIQPTVSSDSLRAEALLLRKGTRTRLLLANMTPTLQQVRVPRAPFSKAVRVTMLDEHNADPASTAPEPFRRQPGSLRELTPDGTLVISLLPYAVAKADQA